MRRLRGAWHETHARTATPPTNRRTANAAVDAAASERTSGASVIGNVAAKDASVTPWRVAKNGRAGGENGAEGEVVFAPPARSLHSHLDHDVMMRGHRPNTAPISAIDELFVAGNLEVVAFADTSLPPVRDSARRSRTPTSSRRSPGWW